MEGALLQVGAPISSEAAGIVHALNSSVEGLTEEATKILSEMKQRFDKERSASTKELEHLTAKNAELTPRIRSWWR